MSANPQYHLTVDDALAFDFGHILDVRAVYAVHAERNLRVLIALDNPSVENREKVFEKQYDLISGFPDLFFDFNLIPARNRAHHEMATDAKLIYTREV